MDLPAEQVAQISAQQEDLGRLNLNRPVVHAVHDGLRTYLAEFRDATPEQVNSWIEANYTPNNRGARRSARLGLLPY